MRRIGVAAFAEEEGSRFGRACLGSRLAVGATSWAEALELTDRTGVRLGDVLEGGAGPLPGWPKNADRVWIAINEAYGRIWAGQLDKAAIQTELDTLQSTVEGFLA